MDCPDHRVLVTNEKRGGNMRLPFRAKQHQQKTAFKTSCYLFLDRIAYHTFDNFNTFLTVPDSRISSAMTVLNIHAGGAHAFSLKHKGEATTG